MSAIRLIGHDHTSHHHGTVLEIADEVVVRNNRNVITESRARELVAKGRAQWVGEPAPRNDLPQKLVGDFREIPAKRKDGTPVTLRVRDLGDSRPAHDEHGRVYEAYQTEWQIDGETHFIVVDKNTFGHLPLAELMQVRLTEDMAFLDGMGIDGASLDFETRPKEAGGPPEGSGQISPSDPSHEEEKAAAKIVRHHDEDQIDDPPGDPDTGAPPEDPDEDPGGEEFA